MSTENPRILLIAQWPTIKNAEYELIERIRQTGFKVGVVDFLGFDVNSKECRDSASLCDEYDFAISFHYETPKFLNLPTFLWVANPLEFIYVQGNYRTQSIHHLRAYDDFLYNGSEVLKDHIKSVVGSEWRDSGLSFFQSCSRNAMLEPRGPGEVSPTSDKIFYCGINWEAISDKSGRAQGLLETLQAKQVADFYGPQVFLDVRVWQEFSSYRGEIPFDGVSIFPAMHGYGAVLAVSSPAHIKSRTSSGRAIEGFAAGVPVISDDNPHVRQQFGDLAYYFGGSTEQERAESILAAMDNIRSRPADAYDRVREAQSLILRDYCFEACIDRILEASKRRPVQIAPVGRIGNSNDVIMAVVDIFLFLHDPYAPDDTQAPAFPNLAHLLRAVSSLMEPGGVRFRLLYCCPGVAFEPPVTTHLPDLEWIALGEDQVDTGSWSRMLLGQKVAQLMRHSEGDFALFLTPGDILQYDYLVKSLGWFSRHVVGDWPAVHLAGFHVNNLMAPAPASSRDIIHNNASVGLYRWSQDSIAYHQLGQFCFNRSAMAALNFARLARFDVVLPIALIMECKDKGVSVHRSRHLLLRVVHGYYHRYHDAFSRVANKGLWAQHYELLSNCSHELSGLYDAFHENPEAVAIADKICGYDLPPPVPTDPAVQQVNRVINRLKPLVRALRRVRNAVGLRK